MTRALNYEDFGADSPVRPAQQTMHGELGGALVGSATPTPAARAEIYRLALESSTHLPVLPEPSKAGTERCHLQVYRMSMLIDTQVNLPSAHPVLAGLVGALTPLLLQHTP